MCPISETNAEGHTDALKCPLVNYCCGNDNCSTSYWVLCFNNYNLAVWFFIAREVSSLVNTLSIHSLFILRHEIQFHAIELIHIQAVITVPSS